MIFGKAVNSRIGHPPVNGNFGENLSIPAFLLQRRTGASLCPVFQLQHHRRNITLRDDYLKEAQKKITDPMILINVVSRRAKQLKSGYKPLIESLERLSAEDMALREVMEGKITYQLAEVDDEA
jgi:DNA-directed RNA polymerase subunit omega